MCPPTPQSPHPFQLPHPPTQHFPGISVAILPMWIARGCNYGQLQTLEGVFPAWLFQPGR